MTVPVAILGVRAITDLLADTLSAPAIVVEQDREIAIRSDETPIVLVYSGEERVDADLLGGRKIVVQSCRVEVIADDGASIASQEQAIALREICRAALAADRTLGGVVHGLHVDAAPVTRTDMSLMETPTARAEALNVDLIYVVG